MRITVYDEDDTYGQIRYAIENIDRKRHHRVMFLTDDIQKAINHFNKFKEIASDLFEFNYDELEIVAGNTKIQFRVIRYDVYKDHYRYSGSEWSSLYFDRDAKFTTEAFTYLTTRVRNTH